MKYIIEIQIVFWRHHNYRHQYLSLSFDFLSLWFFVSYYLSFHLVSFSFLNWHFKSLFLSLSLFLSIYIYAPQSFFLSKLSPIVFQIVPDATLVLPVLVAAGFLLGTEVSALQFYDQNLSNLTRAKHLALRNTLWRWVALAMAFVAAQGPSAVALYWMLSGTSAVALNLALMSPRVRRWVRIPKLKTEEAAPYSKLSSNFQLRFENFVHRFRHKKAQ